MFSLRGWFLETKEVAHNVKLLRQQRVESSGAGRVPSTLGEARSDPLQCARRDSLQEEGGVADSSFSGGDCDAVEAWRYFWSMSGQRNYRHHVIHR